MTRVEYVGHPLAGEVRAGSNREKFCRSHSLDPERPIVALLPGSRHKELVRILPPIYPDPSAPPEREIERLTAAATRVIEEQIRACPEQWMWIHNRWKLRPDGTKER